MLPAYAELHCLSNFTFLRGASHPEELVERAQALGYSALAITDECSLAGVVRAHLAAKDLAPAARHRQRARARGRRARGAARDRSHELRQSRRNSSPAAGATRARARTGSRAPTSRRSAKACSRCGLPPPTPMPRLRSSTASGWRRRSPDARGSPRACSWPPAIAPGACATRRWPRPRTCPSPPPATCTCTYAHAVRCRTRSRPSACAGRLPNAAMRCIPTASATCARAGALPPSTLPRGSGKPCALHGAARSRWTSCVTNIRRRSCRRAPRQPRICARWSRKASCAASARRTTSLPRCAR